MASRRDYVAEHLQSFPISKISLLSPYSGLILSVILIILFLIRLYVLQNFLLEKLYGEKYTSLDDTSRRGFLNHHIAGATKIITLVFGIYPFGAVAFGQAHFDTPFAPGSRVTFGDLLLVCAQLLSGMFIFELTYRIKISPVSVAHHIGSILVAQAAIAININGDSDSSIEFVLCTVWGAFDAVAEVLPHMALILYRVYPMSHVFLSNLFKIACITTFLGTISETVLTMYLFGQLWHRWSLSFKIVTPMLCIAFSAGQFHGTKIFYFAWQKQERLLREKRDLEKAEGENAEDDSRDDEEEESVIKDVRT